MSKGEATRQYIIEKAAPIFNTKGIAATAMSDIMEATKLSKGTLYVHFENKDLLASCAVDYNMEQLSNKLRIELSQFKTAREKLFGYLDFFVETTKPIVIGGCPMLNFGTEADDTNELIKLKVNNLINKSQKLLSDIIKQGITNGEFKADWNANEFATIMFAMLEGGILICRVAGDNSKMKVINDNLKKMITEQML
ncbi:TetR/AcrR family transcriptional regulator [Algoriphagus aestuariicola]|uniref:TetR/AcrR family transcriptional regulator n=1 Tax=Algoriphagus aestuariicola TaxID=1852016 RepID=A0ABS3BRM4_9BACT|nr:TetR/AcrR family transcriptional regulator [Algoriphagus aestuariicola]MBN7800324.1 TetR/AcrR family transcriptional regulator [Algoriphagus aestuariicola]